LRVCSQNSKNFANRKKLNYAKFFEFCYLCAVGKGKCIKIRYEPYTKPFSASKKRKKIHRKKQKPTAQIAHLFFANAEIPTLKKQKSYFFPTLIEKNFNGTGINCNFVIICKY